LDYDFTGFIDYFDLRRLLDLLYFSKKNFLYVMLCCGKRTYCDRNTQKSDGRREILGADEPAA